MNELINYIKNDLAITDEIQQQLNDIIVERKLVKGEIILHENSLKKEHIFVESGCLRSFYKS